MRRRRERRDLRCLAITAARRGVSIRRDVMNFLRRLQRVSPSWLPAMSVADPLRDRYFIFRYRAIETPKIATAIKYPRPSAVCDHQ